MSSRQLINAVPIDPPPPDVAAPPPPQARAPARPLSAHVPALCLAGLALLFVYFTVYDFHRLSNRPPRLGDFDTYYQAARAMRDGRDPYALWSEQYYVYPPLFAFLVTPLTRLSVVGAARVFLTVNLACMAATLLVASREMLCRLPGGAARNRTGRVKLGAVAAVALLTALLTENTIRGGLQSHETDVLMLFLLTAALAWLDRRPALAGGALAMAFNIKYLSIAMLPWLLLRRRWKAAGAFVVAAVAFALLPAVLLGWQEDLRCVRAALRGPMGWVHRSDTGQHGEAGKPVYASPTNAGSTKADAARVLAVTDMVSTSITSSFARRVARAGGRSLWPAFAGAAAVAGGCVALAAWMYARRGVPCWVWPSAAAQSAQPFRWMIAVEWAGLIAFLLAFSPDTNMRHVILAVLVNAAAAAALLFGRGGSPGAGAAPVSRRPLLLGTILLCLALLLPWKGVMSHNFFIQWYRCAVPSWSLLVAYATLLWVGLGLAAADTRAGWGLTR